MPPVGPTPPGPGKYRTKPTLIEAIQLTPTTYADVLKWVGKDNFEDKSKWDPNNLYLKKPDGNTIVVQPTDWLIKVGHDAFIMMSDAAFKLEYERADASRT